MSKQKQKVLVALSGGVDSSVSAALLQQEGYDVEGAFIVTWTAPWLPCTWRDERRDAMRVAAHLRIPFHTVDLSHEYERNVVQYLVSEYAAGRTPNPDVMCNKYIKFGGLFDWALAAGFDYVATGHYARVQEDVSRRFQLLQGCDTQKDQSYFLWTLTQTQLARTLFPIGALEKTDVRSKAEAFGLSTASKKDSQGVCFLGKIDMKEFLSHYIEPVQGDVLDAEGCVIGSHDGAVFVTLGQRHGFTVHHTSPDTPPLYVVAKDVVANTITVAPRTDAVPEAEGGEQCIRLTQVHWIAGTSPETDSGQVASVYEARLRYRQKRFPVALRNAEDATVTVMPEQPKPYVQAGQSLVLYKGDVCVGGGVIDSV